MQRSLHSSSVTQQREREQTGLKNKEKQQQQQQQAVEGGQEWKKRDDEGEDEEIDRTNSLKTVARFGGNDCDLDSSKMENRKRQRGREEDKIGGVGERLFKQHCNNPCG